MSILKNILLQKHRQILWFTIFLYIIIFSFFCLYKYYHFGYNSLDLAILNQVFFNTAHGDFFASSINYPSYLGDHFKPIILLLLPVYFVWQSPQILLIIQTFFLALAAWPLYLIGKKLFTNPLYYLILPTLFLLNSTVASTNLFEFHLLPIAYFTLFFSFYFYLEKKFWPFFIFACLSMMIREDVSLFIFCFGFFILYENIKTKEKRHWYWFVVPIILSVLYFLVSLKIISYFNTAGGYKFITYYSWLGNSFTEIIKNFFSHPLVVVKHLFLKQNIEMVLGLLVPFAFFVPLASPRYLILTVLTFGQFALSNLGGGGITVQTHYATLLNIPLFLAVGSSLKRINENQIWQKRFYIITGILFLATLYSMLLLGPKIVSQNSPKNIETKKEFITKACSQVSFSQNATIVASYEILPIFSSRSNLYPLSYVFLGKKQFSTEKYLPPQNIDFLLADMAETITYQFQFGDKKYYQSDYYRGAKNLRDFINEHKLSYSCSFDTTILFEKNTNSNNGLGLVDITHAESQNKFNCQGYDDKQNIAFICQTQFSQRQTTNHQLQIQIKKDEKEIYTKILPFAYGFYQTTELETTDLLTIKYLLTIPPDVAQQKNQICINLVYLDGDYVLNQQRSGELIVKNIKTIDSSCW
ncbi:MAG: DUF2079 domain-containing protein [Patescibacteria group bacterium]|jgi:uncharacterized membrane protein